MEHFPRGWLVLVVYLRETLTKNLGTSGGPIATVKSNPLSPNLLLDSCDMSVVSKREHNRHLFELGRTLGAMMMIDRQNEFHCVTIN